MPERIQLRRTKGWRKPEGAVVVSRPSKWGNPWRVEMERDERGRRWHRVRHLVTGEGIGAFVCLDVALRTATSQFRTDLERGALPYSIDDVERELAGRDLCCWCPPAPMTRRGSVNWLRLACHADVLVEYANLSAVI